MSNMYSPGDVVEYVGSMSANRGPAVVSAVLPGGRILIRPQVNNPNDEVLSARVESVRSR